MKEREDKSVLTEPRCPFCRELFDRPGDVTTELGFFQGGICSCGAVYAFDPGGRNLGEAFVDALTYACREDWTLAWSLSPSEDYVQYIISYDLRRHRVSPKKGDYDIQGGFGKLVFVKIKEDVLESGREGRG